MIKSDHTYFQQVQQAMGVGSKWTRDHTVAAGLDDTQSTVAHRARATLRLYAHTVETLAPILEREHLLVARGALQMLTAAGLLAPGKL
jgi:hypothetical protein